MTLFVGHNDESGWREKLTMRGAKLGSGKFCEIGPIAACMTDYPEHIAPKSPHQYRLESVYELQVAYN